MPSSTTARRPRRFHTPSGSSGMVEHDVKLDLRDSSTNCSTSPSAAGLTHHLYRPRTGCPPPCKGIPWWSSECPMPHTMAIDGPEPSLTSGRNDKG